MNLLVILLFSISWLSHAQDTVPCRKDCMQTLRLEGGDNFTVYANYPLDQKNDRINHVIVVVQGAERQAGVRFDVMARMTRREKVQGNTLVISPHFKTPNDESALEPLWTENGWKEGADAVYSQTPLSSFAVVDEIIRGVLEKDLFKHVTHVTVTGHSAGGQFTQMYALTSPIVEQFLKVSFRFLVMNPSSYTYLNNERLTNGQFLYVSCEFGSIIGFAELCPTYNDYKFGLENRPPYSQALNDRDLVAQYLQRKVIYALGNADSDINDPMLNKSCAANLQGAHRYQRGKNYFAHINYMDRNHNHEMIEVSFVGHECQRMYSDANVLLALFGGIPKANIAGRTRKKLRQNQAVNQSVALQEAFSARTSYDGCLAEQPKIIRFTDSPAPKKKSQEKSGAFKTFRKFLASGRKTKN